MLKENAVDFMELGMRTYDATAIFQMDSFYIEDAVHGRRLTDEGVEEVRKELRGLLLVAQRLELSTSISLLERRLNFDGSHPTTKEGWDLLVEVIKDEIKSRLFFFVPPERAKYYDRPLPREVTAAFPTPSRELTFAGRCIGAGLFTASVFHSMRAAEIGVQIMGSELGVAFTHPIDLAGWGEILREIEKKLEAVKQKPRTIQRDDELTFYSGAASQFRHFNNAWRVRIAHARATADQEEASKVIDHVTDFFVTLSARLREAGI